MRVSSCDHLYSFRRHGGALFHYINLAVSDLPESILSEFDGVIFHTHLLARRWVSDDFKRIIKKIEPLKKYDIPKLALPQDDYFKTDDLIDFYNSNNVTHVYTVAPEDQWEKLYGKLVEKLCFKEILTGYLEDDTTSRINSIMESQPERDIDIGYRAWQAPFWLGRHGQQKVRVAHEFESASQRHGFNSDISLRLEDTFVGDSWYEFLCRCRYTIGVEGGASINDRDGTLQHKVEQYVRENPDADFDTVEDMFFKGRDGELSLFALSPRHLEACASKTCQILLPGRYNGILKEGIHYISVKEDYSDIDEVMSKVNSQRENIVNQAYEDIVLSGRYSYSTFVKNTCFDVFDIKENSDKSFRESFLSKLWRVKDGISWARVAVKFKLRQVKRKLTA